MFPNSDFKENYLYTSNESINRKEDRILNRDYSDPYKLERKIADMYERDENSKKFNLNTQPNDSFKATLGTLPNMSSSPGNMLIQEEDEMENNFSYENYHKRNFSSPMSPEEEVTPNLNYKYDDHNKFKREGGHSKNNSNLSEISTGRNNHRYKSRSNFSEEFNPNTQSNPVVNVSYIKDIKTEQHENYNNELKYYKEMIEKMHSEIGNLNSKLSDIEKNNLSSGKNIGQLGVSGVSGLSGVSATFNNLIHNNPNSSTRSYTNSQLSTANFRKENSKYEISELISEKNTHRDLQDFNICQQGQLGKLPHHIQLSNQNEFGLKNKTEKILNLTNNEKIITTEHPLSKMNYNYDSTHLLQKREYLLKKEDEKISSLYIDYKDSHNSYNDKEREKNELINYNMKIKRTDSPSNSHKTEKTESKFNNSLGVIKNSHISNNSDIVPNLISKNNIPNNHHIRNYNKTPNRITREEKSTNSKSTKTRSTSVDKFKRNNSNNKITEVKTLIYQSSPSNHSKITKSTGKNISSNKSTLLNQLTPTTKKPSVSSIRNSKQECEVISNLQKENEELKSKITNLEKSLKNINYQLSLDALEKKGRDYLRVELEIWKNRSETIANSYIETTSNMKKQLLQDKSNFVDQIKSMQNTYTGEINQLKNKYQSTIEKYENSIKRLRKDNEELKIKVSKVKEILTPNK